MLVLGHTVPSWIKQESTRVVATSHFIQRTHPPNMINRCRYVFFEKKRIFEKKAKTELRRRQEEAFPRGRELDSRRNRVWVGPGESASYDRLGQIVIHGRGRRWTDFEEWSGRQFSDSLEFWLGVFSHFWWKQLFVWQTWSSMWNGNLIHSILSLIVSLDILHESPFITHGVLMPEARPSSN